MNKDHALMTLAQMAQKYIDAQVELAQMAINALSEEKPSPAPAPAPASPHPAQSPPPYQDLAAGPKED